MCLNLSDNKVQAVPNTECVYQNPLIGPLISVREY